MQVGIPFGPMKIRPRKVMPYLPLPVQGAPARGFGRPLPPPLLPTVLQARGQLRPRICWKRREVPRW
jgi:hypothetical protein